VLPRVLATAVMTVCVAVVGNLMGVFGGLSVAVFNLGIGSDQYLRHTFDAVDLDDFITGLIKAGVFGVLISGIACYLGLSVTGGGRYQPSIMDCKSRRGNGRCYHDNPVYWRLSGRTQRQIGGHRLCIFLHWRHYVECGCDLWRFSVCCSEICIET